MKKYLIIIALLGAIILPGQARAEDSSTERKDALEVLKAQRDASQELIREKRDAFFEEAKDVRDQFRTDRKDSTGDPNLSRSELEALIKAKREALRAEIEAIKKERVSTRKAFVENRFNQVIVVLTAAQERIGAKITEFEGKGYDMTEAKSHLELSKTSLAEAKALLATLSTTPVSDTDETTADGPREIAKKIEGFLQETRTHLVEAIKAMRAEINPESDDDDTATTS